MWRPAHEKERVMFFGWVFFLISLGGQAPHVRPMGVHRACGEPNEIELTPIGVKSNGSRRVRCVKSCTRIPLLPCHTNMKQLQRPSTNPKWWSPRHRSPPHTYCSRRARTGGGRARVVKLTNSKRTQRKNCDPRFTSTAVDAKAGNSSLQNVWKELYHPKSSERLKKM